MNPDELLVHVFNLLNRVARQRIPVVISTEMFTTSYTIRANPGGAMHLSCTLNTIKLIKPTDTSFTFMVTFETPTGPVPIGMLTITKEMIAQSTIQLATGLDATTIIKFPTISLSIYDLTLPKS